MSNKYQFLINCKSPLVESRVSSLMGTKELEEGSEGTSHEINNYFDELVAKKNGQKLHNTAIYCPFLPSFHFLIT